MDWTNIAVAVATWLTLLGTLIATYVKTKEGQATLASRVENLEARYKEQSCLLERGDTRMKEIETKAAAVDISTALLNKAIENFSKFTESLHTIQPMSNTVDNINDMLADMIEKQHNIDMRLRDIERGM